MGLLTDWISTKRRELKLRNEAKGAVQGLIENSSLRPRFVIMSILSGIVATCGIVLQDTSILIAAMVLAPLLNPLLSIGAGIVLRHSGLVLYSLRSFIGGFAAVIVVTTVLSIALHYGGAPVTGAPFLARFAVPHTLPVLLIVAFFSGFGAVYAWLKEAKSANFVAVAIAVALIPFVSLYGIVLGVQEWHLLPTLTLVLFSNLILIILGAVAAFAAMGVHQRGVDVDQEIEEVKQAEGSLTP